MKRIPFVILALAATFTFACRQENYANTSTTSGTETAGTETTGVTATNTAGTSTGAPKVSAQDQDFMTQAAAGGMMEVNLGQLAAAKATRNEVRDFGNRMVTDHGKANDELKQLATNKGVTLPAQPGVDEQKTSNELSSKTGRAFVSKTLPTLEDHLKMAKQVAGKTK